MSTYQVPGADGCTSWKTATDCSSYQYHVMQISAAKTAGIGEANGDLSIGILQNKPTSGIAARVATQYGMICKAYAGAAITPVGSQLASDGDGHIILAVDNDIVIAHAVETAGAAGDIIEVLLVPPHHVANVSYFVDGS